MRKAMLAMILGATFMVSTAPTLRADDHPKRYYDRSHKDYHEWNDSESTAYRHWLVDEQHKTYHDWNKASKSEQSRYWQWRHDHPDSH